jgi:hypothetical protein
MIGKGVSGRLQKRSLASVECSMQKGQKGLRAEKQDKFHS